MHRLVEIHYHIGLENEAKKYASILGYNYNSGEWFKQSYKVLNKDYKIIKKMILKTMKLRKIEVFLKKLLKWLSKFNDKKNEIIKKFKGLLSSLKKHNKFYYVEDSPRITDPNMIWLKKKF